MGRFSGPVPLLAKYIQIHSALVTTWPALINDKFTMKERSKQNDLKSMPSMEFSVIRVTRYAVSVLAPIKMCAGYTSLIMEFKKCDTLLKVPWLSCRGGFKCSELHGMS